MALSRSMAQDAEDERKREREAKRKKATTQKAPVSGGTAGGAAKGASVGMAGGPFGALVGAGLGAAAGAADVNKAQKDAASSDPNRSKRRRLQKGIEEKEKVQRRRERALAALSQAVMDWSSAIR